MMFDIDNKTDEELLEEYSVTVEGRTFVPARLLDEIGIRQAKNANRKPGDPGTVENPIFRNGKAYVYSKRNELILWEDYAGPIPQGFEDGVERFTLTMDMKPTEEQKKMIQKAKEMPVRASKDCPLIPADRLSGFSRFRSARPVLK